MKPTLTLQPSTHRQQDVVLLHFDNHKPLHEAVKSLGNARWSNTMKSWSINKDVFKLATVFTVLSPIACKDYFLSRTDKHPDQ
jgi:hypothetical protein